MNFFRITFLLCTRVSALPQLMAVPAWRTALHTLLILLICPALLAAVLTGRDSESRRQTVGELFRETGGLVFRGNELALGSGAGERHLSFMMIHPAYFMRRGACRFDFISETGGKKYPDPEWQEKTGVIATPSFLFFWDRYDNLYKFIPVPAGLAKLYLIPEKTTREERDRLYGELMESWRSIRIISAAGCQAKISESLQAGKTETAAPRTESAEAGQSAVQQAGPVTAVEQDSLGK